MYQAEFDSVPHLSRRSFLQLTGKATILGSVAHLLGVHTAQAAQVVDGPLYIFHGEGRAIVESVVRANLRAGRTPVTVKSVGEMIRDEIEVPGPVFGVTFDDGLAIQYEQVAPMLDYYGVPGTFFVMGTAWEGDRVHRYMAPWQIEDLYWRGHEIGSHTVSHRNLVTLRRNDFNAYVDEITHSRDQLQELIGDEVVTTFSYPNGAFNSQIAADVSELYKTAVSTLSGRLHTEGVNYALRRMRA